MNGTPRVPVHLVVGPPGSGKSAWIAAQIAARGAGDWLGIVNRLAAPHPRLRELRGCFCCTGRVVLQTSLARLLRELRPVRVIAELDEAEHLRAVQRMLAEWPLGQYVYSAETLSAQPILRTQAARSTAAGDGS